MNAFHKPPSRWREREKQRRKILKFFVLLSHLSWKEAWSLSVTVFLNWAKISPGAFMKKALCEIYEKCDCSRGIFINFPSIAIVCFLSLFLHERGFVTFIAVFLRVGKQKRSGEIRGKYWGINKNGREMRARTWEMNLSFVNLNEDLTRERSWSFVTW